MQIGDYGMCSGAVESEDDDLLLFRSFESEEVRLEPLQKDQRY